MLKTTARKRGHASEYDLQGDLDKIKIALVEEYDQERTINYIYDSEKDISDFFNKMKKLSWDYICIFVETLMKNKIIINDKEYKDFNHINNQKDYIIDDYVKNLNNCKQYIKNIFPDNIIICSNFNYISNN